MKFYYSISTGEYSGTVKPVSDGFGSTLSPVPIVKDRESAFFKDGEWVIVESEVDNTSTIMDLEAELTELKKELNYNLAMGYDTSHLVVRAREIELMLEELNKGD